MIRWSSEDGAGVIIREEWSSEVCDEKEVIRAIQGWAPPSSGSHSCTDTLSIIYLPQCWPQYIQIHIQVDSSWLKFTKTWVHCGYIQSQPSILILVQIKSTTSFLHLPSFWWFISRGNQKWNEVLMVKIIEVDLKTILLSFFDHLPMQKLGPTMIMQPWPSELHWKLNHYQSRTWSSER